MSRSNQLSMYKTSIFNEEGMTKVVYHSTPIVSFDSETIILNTGGWQSVTTKRKMNQASSQFGLGFSVTQKNFEWFINFKGETFPFDKDVMTLER